MFNPSTMKTKPHSLILLTLLAGATLARADVVTDWNDIAVPLIRAAPNVTGTRQFALVHVAMFDAANAVDGRYSPYFFNVSAPGASAEAAVARAAHDMLVRLYPASSAALHASLATSLATVPDNAAKASGLLLGEAVAAQLWNLRRGDASTLVVTNPFPAGPGLYQQTPGGPANPVSQQYAYVTPWALRSSSQFRPGPPPSLGSAQWAVEYNEIKRLGGAVSAERTPEQTDIALFIIDLPHFLVNTIARQAVLAHPMPVVDSARVFALMHLADADAGIAVWDAKYAYNFWRPVTAIQHADIDGNDDTEADATWLPLRPTPGHPEYPCAHCTLSAAMCGVLAAIFGDDFTYTLESPSLPGKPRTFHKFSEYAALSLEGRLYAGFHYRNSSVVGLDLGAKVGEWTVKNCLTPGPALSGSHQPGEFRVTLKNNGGLGQRLEYTTNFTVWQPLTNFVRTDLSFEYRDTEADTDSARFYRSVAR